MIGEVSNAAIPIVLLLVVLADLPRRAPGAVEHEAPVLERAIRAEPGEWVRILGGRPASPRPTGPVLFSCGVPSQKMGPAFLVAFDAHDLIVVRQGVLRTTTIRIRRTDAPGIHFREPTRLQERAIEINARAGAADIRKGPVTSIARYLAACGWVVDPMPDPTSTKGRGEVVSASAWTLPEMDSTAI